jgi:hypothetical protein
MLLWRMGLIDALICISYDSYVNSVGSNAKPRQERFDGFTQNNLEQNREKCQLGAYPKNIIEENGLD